MQSIPENEAKELMFKYQEIVEEKFPDQNVSVGCYTIASEGMNGKFKVFVSAKNSEGNEELDKYCSRHGIEFSI